MFGIKVNFLTSGVPVSFARRTLLHVISYTGQKPFHTLMLSVPYLMSWFKTNSYFTLCTVKENHLWPLYFKDHFVLTHPTHIQTAVPYSTISPGRLFLIVTLKSAATSQQAKFTTYCTTVKHQPIRYLYNRYQWTMLILGQTNYIGMLLIITEGDGYMKA